MTRDEIMKAFDINEHGVITSPGKFEGEMLYVPYFWDAMLEGSGEDLYFNDGALVTIMAIEDKDRQEFPELGGSIEIALETTDQGFVNSTTDADEITKIRSDYEKESAAPEEPLAVTEGAHSVHAQEDVGDPLDVGDKVEFPVRWAGETGVGQGEIAQIEDDRVLVYLEGDHKQPEWISLDALRKIDEYRATMSPEDVVKSQEESLMDPIAASEDARKMVIQAMGYKDVAAQVRACFLLGLAEQKLWKSAVDQIKKKHEKEMKEKVKGLSKWGTVRPSEAAIKDVIAKVLISHGISPYPNLIAGLYANPFQDRGSVVPEKPNETMSEPR